MTSTQRPPSVLGDRFRTHRVLKAGEDIQTLVVVELPSGAERVAKVARLNRLPIGVRLRLQHEAEVLRELASPWIAPVIDAGVGHDHLYLITDYVPGPTLAERLAAGPLSVSDTVTVGRCVLAALTEAHAHGVAHRDIKPSNVILCFGSPADAGSVLESAVLVDFGLAGSERLDPSVRDLPVGTARYMAPEQAGLLNVEVDHRADLYSVGVVLYECLVGSPPFGGESLREVLRQHLVQPPPAFSTIGVQAPRALEEVVARLLAKDPGDRYQSAEGALADLDDIAAALDRGEDDPPVVVGVRDRRRTLTQPSFVGRDWELAVLADGLQAARRGEARLLLVESESGGGKTRLLDEFAQRANRAGVRVLRGQGIVETAQRPLEVLRGVAADVLGYANDDPTFADRLRAELDERAAAVCAALPELTELLQPPTTTAAPEAYGETRTVEGLTALLASLGTAEAPAVVILDDCQWADELTLKVLRRWHEHVEAEPAHTRVVAAFRTEEVGPEHPLRRIQDDPPLGLEPLHPADLRRLIASMAGPVPDEIAAAVVELADGSPFMASAVLLGLVESGELAADEHGWRVDEAAAGTVTASRRAGTMLARRLSLLPRRARRLLEVGAVAGKQFDLELATALLDDSVTRAGAALERCRQRHLVWVRGTTATFVHDKIREAVLDQLDPEAAVTLHRRAAEWLETRHPERVFELAYHWESAGDSTRALPYALEAAALARAQHALQTAEDQYAIAERGARTAEAAVRREVAEGKGDVLMLRGRYEEAGAGFAQALELAETDLDRARIQGKRGELSFKSGDMQAARQSVEAALRLLGSRVPRTSLGFVVAAVLEIVVQAAHSLLPRVFLGRRETAGAEQELVAIRLYSRLAHVYWFVAGRVPTAWAHLREMNLAERYPPGAELAQAYSEHAPVMTMLPWFSRGIRYAERSLAIRRDLEDLWGQGQSLHFLGVVLYGASRFDECIARCQEAVRLLELTGDRWEVNTASWHIAFSRYRLGDLAEALDAAQRVHAAGAEIGDPQARGISLAAWAKASDGRLPRDLLDAELQRPADDVHTRAELLQAEALWLLHAGQPADAVQVLEDAWAQVRRAGLRQEYVVAIRPWLATARRHAAETVPAWSPRQRRRLLRRARRDARRAVRIARAYRNNAPHALREHGLVLAMSGRARSARRRLDAALAAAEELGMRAERARTLVSRGDVGAALGWPGAAEDLATGQAALAELTAALERPETVTLSLIDRFDSALDAGRRIASALAPDDIHAALVDAAQALLRAERCVVVDVSGAEPTPIGGNGDGAFSRTLVAEAVAAGGPVVSADADAGESLVLADVRSALCAPISVRGRTVACLYTDHRKIGDLFGEDEERLAAFLVTLAGAALENAEGFAEIQELTRTLERRVEQRTAQLAESNEQLRVAYQNEQQVSEQLKRLNQLKDDFMNMAAHDLRSPIAIISGFATTMQAGRALPDDQIAVCVDSIVRNTKRLSEFVENLLEFGRIESGESVFDLRPFDLGELVQRTVAELAGIDPPVTFSVDVPERLPVARGDEQRHWQVLTNLLSNAVKFSPEGATVHVRVAVAGGELQVSVRDEGAGIAREDLPRLFQKFSRVQQHDGRKRAFGTGLGLYICRSLVEAQGGRIWVDSKRGHGSTFTYTVQLAAGEAAGQLPVDSRQQETATP